MGNDLDSLDDIFADEAAKKARAVGKFQPKPKFRPQRKGPAAISVTSSLAVQTIDSAPKGSSEPSEAVKPLEQKCSVPPAPVALNVPNSEDIGGTSETFALSPVEDSTHPCGVADVSRDPGLSVEADAATADEPVVSSANVHDDMVNTELEREEVDVLDSISITKLTDKSGQRTGKFPPKPKLQMQKKMQSSESVSNSLGLQSVPPAIDDAEKDPVTTSQPDDILDLSSLGFTHTLPTEETSELPLNEEAMNLMQVAQVDSCIHLEDFPEVPAKLAPRQAKTGSRKAQAAANPSSQQQKACISSEENGTGRLLRPRKSNTNLCQQGDEDRDEVLTTAEISEGCSPNCPTEEENINNDEIQDESESQKKKSKRKSKKTDDGKEKPAKKRKNAKEASDQEVTKRKKFSHSTRRRRVDRTLLVTPEDEIDIQKLPLRDIIQLAEHREWLNKRDGAASGAPTTNQSTGNSSGTYNDENFTTEQGGEDNDEETPMVDTTEYFNYHSYMEKTPRTRWSKQDTEQFYEAIRQFGTDLSMIQLLFPGRSRREVKLKYKKEERQHPLRLHEALTNRSKDHSQFQTVIEYLKKIEAEQNPNADKDESIDLTDNGGADEGTSNVDDDEAKDERIEEEENEKVENDVAEDPSPSYDVDDEEDDFLRWSQYTSDI